LFLDDVALGTVADVVPLIGLNRAFVAKGLIALRRRERVGHVSLMDVARLSGPPEAWHLGFLLGPRINAGGRIGRADLGVRLLIEDDPIEAARIAAELDRLNRERQTDRSGNAWRRPRPRPWPRSASRRRARWWSPPRKAGTPASSGSWRRG
jgi:single-stranded DNA-specific DHH superfamily exonuclease